MKFSPNKAGLFETSFFGDFSKIDPQPTLQLLKNILEHVKSEKILTSFVIS